jgi:hypothetical protein
METCAKQHGTESVDMETLRLAWVQLNRSNGVKPAEHHFWRDVVTQLKDIAAWRADFRTWTEAKKEGKMPWLYSVNLVKAIVFLGKNNDLGIPPTIMDHVRKAGLAAYFDEDEDHDEFWSAAEIDNPDCRRVYMMAKPGRTTQRLTRLLRPSLHVGGGRRAAGSVDRPSHLTARTDWGSSKVRPSPVNV